MTEKNGNGEGGEIVVKGPPDDMRVCSTCMFWRLSPKVKDAGVCMLSPPVAHIILQPTQSAVAAPGGASAVRQAPAFLRPETQADDYCASHRFDDELSPHEILASELAAIVRMLQEGITSPPKGG